MSWCVFRSALGRRFRRPLGHDSGVTWAGIPSTWASIPEARAARRRRGRGDGRNASAEVVVEEATTRGCRSDTHAQGREVLRLTIRGGWPHRAIQASTGLSKGSVSDYLKRATTRGPTWPRRRRMSDADVEARLFHAVGRNEPPGRGPSTSCGPRRAAPVGGDAALLCREYQRAAQGSGRARRTSTASSATCTTRGA